MAGAVVVELSTNRTERLDVGSVLRSDAGDLRVAASRPHQGRHVVRFVGVDDRSSAETLRGVELRAEPLEVPGAMWVHELVGARVVTEEGEDVGEVVAVEPNPASDLLVLGDGTLVPLRFVTELEPGVTVTVDVPDGLLG